MTKQEEEIIELKFQSIRELISSEFKQTRLEISHIKEQAPKMEGRIMILEAQAKNCIPLGHVKTRVANLEQFQWKTLGIYAGASGAVGILSAIVTIYITSK